jgi:iron complex outermembrane receptor protein
MQKILNLKQKTMKAMFFMLFLLCSTAMTAQNKVSGTVLDASGEPLIGVSVLEAGTTNGTVTDMDGKFSLTVKQGARLTVSYVGYTSQTVAARNGMTVNLQEDNKLLNEVVVVGYGTMRRKDVTSSITTVRSEDLNKGVFTDPA